MEHGMHKEMAKAMMDKKMKGKMKKKGFASMAKEMKKG